MGDERERFQGVGDPVTVELGERDDKPENVVTVEAADDGAADHQETPYLEVEHPQNPEKRMETIARRSNGRVLVGRRLGMSLLASLAAIAAVSAPPEEPAASAPPPPPPPTRSPEIDGRRLLAAIYRLAKGRPNVEVTKAELAAEVERVGLFDLTDDAFMAYARAGFEEVQAWRAEHPEEAGVHVSSLETFTRAQDKRDRKAAKRLEHARRRQAGIRR